MNKKLAYMALILGLLALVGSQMVMAQEEQAAQEVPVAQDDQAMEEIYEFTFGKVVKISKDQLTILEYNFEAEAEMEATYDVTDKTELMNLDAISSLKIDDEVEIEFKDDNGKKIAMSLAKDEGESYEDLDAQDIMNETDDLMNETQEKAE